MWKIWFHLNQDYYLIGIKDDITYGISNSYAKIKFDSCNTLPIEETLTLHNVIILIKSVFDKEKNNYYYNIFFEKGSTKLPKNNANK